MKGIILAGGKGTRLYPATKVVCKQLLTVFDKPMIYYPLSVLMLSSIKEILIICTKQDVDRFQMLFQDGSSLGLKIEYAVQDNPEGIAQAFIIGKSFIGKDSVALILGDNIFYGHDLCSILQKCSLVENGGIVFGYRVKDPSSYGVVEFDENNSAVAIEEKPSNPKSCFAVPGLYFYDNDVIKIAESLTFSKRKELEITDVNLVYLKNKKLKVQILGRGYTWLDAGTFSDLQKACFFVQTIQERQGIKIACLEEIAYRMGYINKQSFLSLADAFQDNEYGKYLRQCVEN